MDWVLELMEIYYKANAGKSTIRMEGNAPGGYLRMRFLDDHPYSVTEREFLPMPLQSETVAPQDCLSPMSVKPKWVGVEASGQYVQPVINEVIPSWLDDGYAVDLATVANGSMMMEIFQGKVGANPYMISNWSEVRKYCASKDIELRNF
ncbi:MAG: hypothetical protein ACQESG_02025 [Nanobdellota archaeon]